MNYTAQETDDLKYMQESGRGVMVKSNADARKTYPNLFREGVIYYDGFGPSVKLTTKGEQTTSSPTHTPGPWRCSHIGTAEAPNNLVHTFEVYTDPAGDHNNIIGRNTAALIAAAPETARERDHLVEGLRVLRDASAKQDEVFIQIAAERDRLKDLLNEYVKEGHRDPWYRRVKDALNGDTTPAQTVNQELLEALKAIMKDDHTVISTAKVEKAIQAIARAEGKEVANG